MILLLAAACTPPPSTACVPGPSLATGTFPADLLVQWTSVSNGLARAWRLHADGRYDWTYLRPLPLLPVDHATWYEAPALPTSAVTEITEVLRMQLPALGSLQPSSFSDHPSHLPDRVGLDAPGIGSVWYTGPCQVTAFQTLIADLDRILDADGRPRTKIRERGGT